MEELAGVFGTSASFALRLGQTVFSSSYSLLFMCLDVGFYSYTAFCLFYQVYRICMCPTWGFLTFCLHIMLFHGYLVTVMGLVIPWNITLLVVDAYSVFIQHLPVQRRLIMIIFFGDMMLSCLSLAAACSTASIAGLLLDAGGSHCPPKLCGRYQLSAAVAFLSWFISSVSFLFNFWLFSSL